MADLGLGLAALGRPGYINIGHATDLGADRSREGMEQHAHAVLDAAYANGIRYFDAARSYGLAEVFLASWLTSRDVRPANVIVASKWGYTYTADWQVEARAHEIKSHSLETFSRQIAESREILGQSLALYQIHSATLESGVLEDTRVIDALARERDGGLRIGLSVSGPRQSDAIRRAIEIRRDGERVFDSVQATWNLLERGAESALRDAAREGMRVVVKEALANGRLSGRGDVPTALERAAREANVGVDAVALACALARPWATIVLSGATTVPQVESNVRARAVVISAELERELDGIAMDSEEYWSQRSALPWN